MHANKQLDNSKNESQTKVLLFFGICHQNILALNKLGFSDSQTCVTDNFSLSTKPWMYETMYHSVFFIEYTVQYSVYILKYATLRK